MIRVVDLFCGAGGTSTGLALACEDIGLDVDLLAVNHWSVAIETHKKNHPWARHLCKSLDEINPKEAVPGGRVDLLIAAPECTHHSVARGGRPINDQMRMSAFKVVDWLAALYVSSVLIENVREFRDWGPVDAKGQPLRSMRGETYRAFIGAIRSLGYRVEERILNAADYGDPTTRQRLFIIARRGTQKIQWPVPSHCQTGLLGKRWRPAREIIDWTIKGKSIFTRKLQLSKNTLARIEAGLKRFGGVSFLLNLRGTNEQQIARAARSIHQPLPTLTTGNHIAMIEPFILPHRMFNRMDVDSIDRPLRTVTATNGGCAALVEPFIVPFFGERDGQEPRTHSVDEPLPTCTSHGAGGLVEPFLVTFNGNHAGKNDGDRRARSIHDPLATQPCSNRFGLIEPVLVTVNHSDGNARRTSSIEAPVPSITTKLGLGLVESFLINYNGNGKAHSVDEPLGTLTTKDRYGLVQYPLVVVGDQTFVLDILFRMLKIHELAGAMGFPRSYVFAGTVEHQTKQIGNAVAVNKAKALCAMLLRKKRRRKENLEFRRAVNADI